MDSNWSLLGPLASWTLLSLCLFLAVRWVIRKVQEPELDLCQNVGPGGWTCTRRHGHAGHHEFYYGGDGHGDGKHVKWSQIETDQCPSTRSGVRCDLPRGHTSLYHEHRYVCGTELDIWV